MITVLGFVSDPANQVRVGTDSENFGQCVGYVMKWFLACGAPFFYGNAKDLYANAPGGYIRGTNWPAPAGAATVLGASWGGGAGHTQLSVDGRGQVAEQNNPEGSAPHLHTYTSKPNDYIGWIMPTNYTQGGDEVIPDENHLNALFEAFRGRAATPDEVKQYVGASYSGLVEALNGGPERDATNLALATGKTAIQDGWANQIASANQQVKAQGGTIDLLNKELAAANAEVTALEVPTSVPTPAAPPASSINDFSLGELLKAAWTKLFNLK